MKRVRVKKKRANRRDVKWRGKRREEEKRPTWPPVYKAAGSSSASAGAQRGTNGLNRTQ